MSPIAVTEAVATLLWCYAGLTFLDWLRHMRRVGKRRHLPGAMELLGNLVPAMIGLLIVVIAGAMIGLPSVVAIIAVLFPAGLAFGLHLSLNDIRAGASLATELTRIGLALLIGGVVIYLRQVA